jgi:hypothetical protein
MTSPHYITKLKRAISTMLTGPLFPGVLYELDFSVGRRAARMRHAMLPLKRTLLLPKEDIRKSQCRSNVCPDLSTRL